MKERGPDTYSLMWKNLLVHRSLADPDSAPYLPHLSLLLGLAHTHLAGSYSEGLPLPSLLCACLASPESIGIS